jgi:hypothetical protein
MDADAVMPSPPGDQKVKPTRKPKGKPTTTPTGKRSLNLSLTTETYERLLIHAMRMTNGNLSDLVEKLATDHLREFHLTRTPTTTRAAASE